MKMARHKTPGKNLHSQLLPAIIKAFNNYLRIFLSCKNINPVNSGTGDKVKTFWILKFVFVAHRKSLKSVMNII
jgi:hypothetical protein